MTKPFLLDTMLGTLATYLRMCGYDAAYTLDRGVEEDEAVLALARAEDRRLLTRDASLAARSDDALLLYELDIKAQLRELKSAGIDLTLADPPVRCGRCNGRLERVAGTVSTPEYAPTPSEQPVWRCRSCGQHFWKGSHWDDVRSRLASL